MAIPVNLFNANQYNLTVTVNRGTAFTVNAVTATTWAPGTVASGGPGWDNGGASSNNLGPGANVLQVELGTGMYTTVNMPLPNTNPSSIQVYFFFPQTGGVGSVAWYALYAGSVVANGTSGLSATPPQ
ncbi:MAG: hypothetical protein JWM95_4424 [Gemmatimonadetes bacterium]|nr:hypothetical protein [Gemmatimonadota bacterium]